MRRSTAEWTRLRYLVDFEVRQYFRHPRCLHSLPLLATGTVLSAWVYPVASPFVPVIVVTIGALELQLNNIFFRTSNELAVLNLYSVRWHDIVLAKNIATILLGVILFIIGSMTLLYFSPASITGRNAFDSVIYMLTIFFPMLHIGNMRSITLPRPENGFRVDDVIELLWILATLGVVSVPYFLISRMDHGWVMCTLYAVATAFYWYNVSLTKTAEAIEKEIAAICSAK